MKTLISSRIRTEPATFSSILISLIFIAFAATESELSDTISGSNSNQTIEYKLAVIDGDSTPSDAKVRLYGRALDLLERYCPENRGLIADMTVKSKEILRERNIDESLLQLLRNFRNSIPSDANPGEVGNCSEIFAAYISLRVQ